MAKAFKVMAFTVLFIIQYFKWADANCGAFINVVFITILEN